MNNLGKWGLLVALLGTGVWAATPTRLNYTPASPPTSDVLRLANETDRDLVRGTEKRLSWAGTEEKTEWSVVLLHGFSASRQETAPLAENLAADLGANLFEARLTGHGMQQGGMTDVSAEAWLDDAAEALAIGAEIGDKVIVIGVSTGATLAASLLDHEVMSNVDSLVFISPNYFPYDPNAAWLTRPLGKLLTRLIVGKTRSWEPYNEGQGTYWTTRYPSATLIEAMRLVDHANRQLPVTMNPRLQVFYSPDDQVISTSALKHAFENTTAPQKELLEVRDPGDPFHHVLAGDILSPTKTDWMVGEIVRFVSQQSSADVED